jgi:hypothetical protein
MDQNWTLPRRVAAETIGFSVTTSRDIAARASLRVHDMLARVGVAAPPAKGIAMFHFGRCGSTVFARSLDQNPAIDWHGEILLRSKRKLKRRHEFARRVRRARSRTKGIYYGIECQLWQLRKLPAPLPEVIETLESQNCSCFITLTRRNYLRRLVSARILNDHNLIRRFPDENIAPRRVVIDWPGSSIAEGIAEEFRYYHWFYSEVARHLEGRNVLDLSYESDIEPDPRIAYAKTCDFLGIKATPTELSMARVNPFPLTDLIVNYDEIRAALVGTAYEWMLEE